MRLSLLCASFSREADASLGSARFQQAVFGILPNTHSPSQDATDCRQDAGAPRSIFRRLDVHQHIGDAGVTLLDCRLHPMGNHVPFVDGNLSVDPDM